jgi:hypothetical protein
LEVPDPDDAEKTMRIAQLKAATCDLCDAEGNRAARTIKFMVVILISGSYLPIH